MQSFKSFVAVGFVGMIACGGDTVSIGDNGDAIKSQDGGADSCPPFVEPPLLPNGCGAGVAYVPVYDGNGCQTGYTCPPVVNDDGGALVSCESIGGSCVGLTPSSCSGSFADASKVSCGGGVGVGCCVSCPDISQPTSSFCSPDTSTPVLDKNATTGCESGYHCGFSLTDADDGTTLSATKAGSSVAVTLASNGSTGYKWIVSSDGGLGAPTDVYVAPPSGSPPGSAGQQVLTFSNVPVTGLHAVTLEYRRSFGDTTAAKTFVFSVQGS